MRTLVWTWMAMGVLISSATAEGRKLAVVVGVGTYRGNSGLPSLGKAPENDASRLGAALRSQGFTVYEMTQSAAAQPGQATHAPNVAFIRDQIEGILSSPNLGAEDVILISLHGHGVQFPLVDTSGKKAPKFFFCPADATVTGIETAEQVTENRYLLPLEELYADLEKCSAATKLLIVDACRNDPNAPALARAALASATLPTLPPPPGGTVAFFSCKPNQQAIQDTERDEGVFTRYLIEGLQGAADLSLAGRPADGTITFSELSTYVANNTYAYVFDKYKVRQSPELLGNYDLNLPLARIAKEFVSRTTGMKLVLIPAGEFLMGASEDELAAEVRADPVLQAYDFRPERPQHQVGITKPFYMGRFEVTQAEFLRVTGRNPSFFSAEGSGRENVAGLSTDQFPVESVSWYDALNFCNALSDADGDLPYYGLTNVERDAESQSITAATILVNGGHGYRLPTEAEWEYACRAGTTTSFHFGNALNGKQANVNGDFPFGTQTKGAYLQRSTDVNDPRYPINAFGLSQMHGNVGEWCWDGYEDDAYSRHEQNDPVVNGPATSRVERGGSWRLFAEDARAASRTKSVPGRRSFMYGFRVARTR